MGRGNKQTGSAPHLAVQMQELPGGRPPSAEQPLLEAPGSQEAAAPEPEEEAAPEPEEEAAAAPEPGRQSRWSQRVKYRRPKYAVLIAVICLLLLLLAGGIGFVSGVAFQRSSSPPVPPSCTPVPPSCTPAPPSSPPAPFSCPNKWLRSDGKCYFVSQESKNWDSSLEFCKTPGGTLLPAGNEAQEIGPLHNLGGDDYWIGLKKDPDSREWRQLDGAEWSGPIEHDDAKNNCSCVTSGKYVALDCSTQRRWICVLSL